MLNIVGKKRRRLEHLKHCVVGKGVRCELRSVFSRAAVPVVDANTKGWINHAKMEPRPRDNAKEVHVSEFLADLSAGNGQVLNGGDHFEVVVLYIDTLQV